MNYYMYMWRGITMLYNIYVCQDVAYLGKGLEQNF